MLRSRYYSTRALNCWTEAASSGVDGGVVQVVPVSCCPDEKRVSQLVCAAAWKYVGPIIACYVVTNGAGCDVARLSAGPSESARFLLGQ